MPAATLARGRVLGLHRGVGAGDAVQPQPVSGGELKGLLRAKILWKKSVSHTPFYLCSDSQLRLGASDPADAVPR